MQFLFCPLFKLNTEETVSMQEMGKMWQALPEKEKAPYEKKAEAAKKKYAEEMAAYET